MNLARSVTSPYSSGVTLLDIPLDRFFLHDAADRLLVEGPRGVVNGAMERL